MVWYFESRDNFLFVFMVFRVRCVGHSATKIVNVLPQSFTYPAPPVPCDETDWYTYMC